MFSNLSRGTNFDEKDTCQVDISMTGNEFLNLDKGDGSQKRVG